MKYSKKIIKVGDYMSPDGIVSVTPERMKHWENQFKEMKKSGLKIPVPWGHQGVAKPKTYEEKEFLESKYNAGFLEDLRVNKDDELEAIVDIPRNEDADRVGTIVQEVSPQIETAWKDGKGKIWNDVITHLALVTHPVVGDQENFKVLADEPTPAFAMRLSLSNYIHKLDTKGNKDMAEDKKPEKPETETPAEKPENEVETPTDTDTEETAPETPAIDTPADTGSGNSLETGEGGGSVDDDLKAALPAIGLFVPESAFNNPETFKAALLASALTLGKQIQDLGGQHEDEHSFQDLNLPENNQTDQNNNLPGGGEENNGMGNTPSGDNQGLQEQQPQYSMSLQKLENRNLYLEKRLQDADKARMKSDIQALLSSGRITPVIAQRLETEVGTYNLSLNDKGEALPSLIAAKIEEFKLMPEGSAWSNEDKVRLRNAAEEDLPSEFKQLNENDAEAIAEKQLRQSGRGLTLGV